MLKDETLDLPANQGANIAQFVSYAPDGAQRFIRIRDMPKRRKPLSIRQSLKFLFDRLESRSVNIRTFLPDKPDGNPFDYGIMNSADAEDRVGRYTQEGYYAIVNETVRVNDGGFSGVLFGCLMEGAPNETPRGVEKPGCMKLPRSVGFDLIRKVYGFHFHKHNQNHFPNILFFLKVFYFCLLLCPKTLKKRFQFLL